MATTTTTIKKSPRDHSLLGCMYFFLSFSHSFHFFSLLFYTGESFPITTPAIATIKNIHDFNKIFEAFSIEGESACIRPPFWTRSKGN